MANMLKRFSKEAFKNKYIGDRAHELLHVHYHPKHD